MLRICLSLLIFSALTINKIDGQKPSSFVGPAGELECLNLPIQNNQKLLERELKQRKKGRPNHFATPISVSYSPQNDGTWESDKAGYDVWRLRVKSQEAKSLNLGFTKFNMPTSGQLFIYDINKEIILGPFSKADNDDHLQLWTPIIKADELVIELKVLPKDIPSLELELSYINHDFVGFDGVDTGSRSGSCNLDVVCGEADGFPRVDENRDIIQSAAMYHINGVSICSGALINNTANDCTPYFLTAEHCGIRPSNSASLVVYWNYQNSECRQPNSAESGLNGNGMLNQFNSGSEEVADFDDTDMSLILLDDPIPLEAEPYLAGWTREIVLPPSAICIHHPGVEEKRISFEDDSLIWTIAADPSINANGDTSWIIVEDWDLGTTEGGSSGSPLFNEKKQIIGQLFGGFAACGNDLHDYYGLIGKSWEGGGTPETQLKHWLDPIGSDAMTLDGLNCGYFITVESNNIKICEGVDEVVTNLVVSSNFTQAVQLTINSSDPEITYSLDQDVIQAGESASLTVQNLANLATGNYLIEIYADDGINTATTSMNITIDKLIPDVAQLIKPIDNNPFVSNSPTFEWTSVGDVYRFQLSDNNFNDVLVDETIDGDNFFTIDFLEEEKEYFWRVQSLNSCGEAAFSEVFNFTVGTERCFTHHVLNLPLAIPEQPQDNIINLDFDFSSGLSITDVEVEKIRGFHSYLGDLSITLSSESFSSTLMAGNCPNFENFDCGFSDLSNLDDLPCPLTDGEIYLPATPLSNLRNASTSETWNMNFQDVAFLDGGSVEEVTVNYCFTGVDGPVILSNSNLYSTCESDSYSFTAFSLLTNLDSEIELLHEGQKIDINTVQQNDENEFLITIVDFSAFQNGTHEFQLFTGDRSIVYPFLINVSGNENLIKAQLEVPEPESTVEPVDLTEIVWTIDNNNFSNFKIEIATDQDFQNIIFSETINGNSINLPAILEIESKYHLKIATIGSCSETSETFIFYTTGYTAVTELPISKMTVSPNPFLDVLEIKTDEYEGDIEINILDSKGKLVRHYSTQIKSNLKLELRALYSGLYFMEIIAAKEKSVHRIIKVN